jgi:hypothetical protein
MSNFSTLNDPPEFSDDRAFAAESVVAKYCTMGLVSSKKWFPCYIIILDGCVKMYVDEMACDANPQDAIMMISLGDDYRASGIKRKDYSIDPSHIAEFHCFYIEQWNDLVPLRKLKIGCFTRDAADKLIRSIDINTRQLDENVV